MEPASTETEIKLRFADAAQARTAIEGLDAGLVRERHFEDNRLYDRATDPLGASGRLLRLRRVGDQAVLTFKAPVDGKRRHKVRIEHESAVRDPEAIARMLAGLDFAPGYRYQKYRTVYELQSLTICLDETPIGCFVELEGEPTEIDQVAARMGFSPDQYECRSYRELHAAELAALGQTAGDMVF